MTGIMDLRNADIPALTPRQEEILKQFRESVSDAIGPDHDDYFLLRWLRARCWDTKKAEPMLRASLEWRKQNDADGVLRTWTPPEVLTKYYPCGIPGLDKEGSPIWLESIGSLDIKGIMHSAKKADILKYKMQLCEMMLDVCNQQSDKLGRKVGRIVCIYDFQNFGLSHLWKPGFDLVTRLFALIESNYPEFLKICFVINAPRIFPIAYNVFRPFLNEETRRKVHVLGRNWQEKVFQYVDRDQMPVHWGGTLTGPDGDPYCKDKICIGGEVPKSYYLKDSVEVDPGILTPIVVGRGGNAQVELEVTEPNSAIRWYFTSESFDVSYGIFRKTSETAQSVGDMEVVVPMERANSHMVPEDGTVTVQHVGTYVVRFDNSYSWVNAKKVLYSLEVLAPTGDLIADVDWVDGNSKVNGSK